MVLASYAVRIEGYSNIAMFPAIEAAQNYDFKKLLYPIYSALNVTDTSKKLASIKNNKIKK